MKNKSIKLNAILNIIKSTLSILFPLITYPYAVRILGVTGVGKINYAESIVSYFALIAALGISVYAVREGAKIRDDKEKFNIFANEVLLINIITTIIAYVLLFFTLVFIKNLDSYYGLIFILSLSMILTTIGVDWINTIYEDFAFITIRSIITHFITMFLLFLFIRTSGDLYKYAFLTIATNGIICITNLFYCRKYVRLNFKVVKNIGKHLKPMITLFANNLAILIYVNSDITMLGWFLGDFYVGLYSAAVKIYKIIKSILVAIYGVVISRLSNYYGNQDYEAFKKLFTDLVNVLVLIVIPSGIGLIVISKEVILLIAGEEFIDATITLQILGIGIIFSVLGGAFTNCLNIPLGREKINMKITMLSAIINVILNFLFIKLFLHNGAAITTVISEAFVFLTSFLTFPNKHRVINLKSCIKNCFHALCGSISIILIGCLFKLYISNEIIRMFFIIISSSLIYVIELFLLKNEYLLTATKSFVNKFLK